MSGLRVDLLTQRGNYAEPVIGLMVFCGRVRLLWVFLKVEKKNWVNPAFSTGGIRTHDTRIRSTVALPTISYEAWRKQIVAGFVIL